MTPGTTPTGMRPFDELSTTGLLWLVNRVALHPRGFAMALVRDENGEVVGWTIVGDGAQPLAFSAEDDDTKFAAVEQLLSAHAAVPRAVVAPPIATTESALERRLRDLERMLPPLAAPPARAGAPDGGRESRRVRRRRRRAEEDGFARASAPPAELLQRGATAGLPTATASSARVITRDGQRYGRAIGVSLAEIQTPLPRFNRESTYASYNNDRPAPVVRGVDGNG